MKEPHTGCSVPYSALPLYVLRNFAAGLNGDGNQLEAGYINQYEPEHFDLDFRRRYAAILLRERGL